MAYEHFQRQLDPFSYSPTIPPQAYGRIPELDNVTAQETALQQQGGDRNDPYVALPTPPTIAPSIYESLIDPDPTPPSSTQENHPLPLDSQHFSDFMRVLPERMEPTSNKSFDFVPFKADQSLVGPNSRLRTNQQTHIPLNCNWNHSHRPQYLAPSATPSERSTSSRKSSTSSGKQKKDPEVCPNCGKLLSSRDGLR